jgi:hypothetical protein
MLYRERADVYYENIRNTQIYSVGRMQGSSVLKRVVRTVTTGLYKVKGLYVLISTMQWEKTRKMLHFSAKY